MQYANATAEEVKLAQSPHNLFITGLFMFDLLMTPAILALKIGFIGLLIPLVFSGSLITYIYLRSKKTTTWFVDMHWKLTFTRAQWLMSAYAVSGALILLAWLLSLGMSDAHMGHIIWTALTRIGLMPTLIMVLVTAVMEFSGSAMAIKREVPDKLAANFPPPRSEGVA